MVFKVWYCGTFCHIFGSATGLVSSLPLLGLRSPLNLTSSIVAITYLQHTGPTIAHNNPATWTYTRGAAATIVRKLGFIGRHLFHGITETHVLHHHASTMPFCNANKATKAIKPIKGTNHLSDPREGPMEFLQTFYTHVRICQWVEPSLDAH